MTKVYIYIYIYEGRITVELFICACLHLCILHTCAHMCVPLIFFFQGDIMIVIISGGGSALLPLPVAGVSIEEKAMTCTLLSRAGASIHVCIPIRAEG